MDQSMCSDYKSYDCIKNSRGFTILEVLVASVILVVGLVAIGGLIGSTLGNTSRSQYMTQAATLATEKLEDLNRYPSSDAHVAVTGGTTAGDLTTDALNNVTVNGVTVPINYYDEEYFSPTQGALVETGSSLDANGNTQYSTITYTPDGQISTSALTTTAPSTTGSIAFERRWFIEKDTPVAGVRRITVLVTLLNQSVQPPVTFQMSMVRP
jgi:prepilin-type N-terminal cleavage/methylation domain-containing protein